TDAAVAIAYDPDRCRDIACTARTGPNAEMETQLAVLGTQRRQLYTERATSRRTHEYDEGLAQQVLATHPKQQRRRPIRVRNDSMLVGDDVPQGRALKERAVTKSLGLDECAASGQLLGLDVKLFFGDLQFLEGERQLIEKAVA